jgi:predicted enzyme related to lactoylglutathione lyase
MPSGLKTIIYPVSDLASAKSRFATLFGVEPYIDQPYYVAFNVDGNDVGLDPQGHSKGMTGGLPYWLVSDIRASIDELVSGGAELQQDATDVGGGNLIATVKDADGNLIGLMQAA